MQKPEHRLALTPKMGWSSPQTWAGAYSENKQKIQELGGQKLRSAADPVLFPSKITVEMEAVKLATERVTGPAGMQVLPRIETPGSQRGTTPCGLFPPTLI